MEHSNYSISCQLLLTDSRIDCEVCLSHPIVAQVWRPLRGPVDDSPLGMVDAASVAKEDLLPYTLHFPGRVGYNYAAKYNPEHR